MTNPNSAAQAAEQDQIAALQDLRHGVELNRVYLDDGDIKLAALDAAIALLSKLRAPVSDIREGFELTYAANADDPACASDLSHFTNGWRACIMSQVGKPVVMKLEVDTTATIARINDEVARLRAPVVADIRIGVSATRQGAAICIMQPHADGSTTTIYSEMHPLGDSMGHAALASAPVAVPPGWKLVPIEPTPEMEDAGCDVPCPQDGAPPPSTVYAAMIGVAPPAPGASAPVAGEAQPSEASVRAARELLEKIKKSHGHWGGWSSIPSVCDEAIGLLRASGTDAAPQASAENDREAWAADMLAAGAMHLGGECWEWESEDFLFHLWQVATRCQRAAQPAPSQPTDKEQA